MPSPSNLPPLGTERLTPREQECLRLVAQHLSSKQIARELAVSQHTVDGHLNEARRKLGAATRRDAARMLLEMADGSPPSHRGGKSGDGEHAPPPQEFAPPENLGGQAFAVVENAAPSSAEPSSDDREDGHDSTSESASAEAAPPDASGSPRRSGLELRHELTPPQRLAAVVVIATLSALLLLLLLLGVHELTRLFEQLTEAG